MDLRDTDRIEKTHLPLVQKSELRQACDLRSYRVFHPLRVFLKKSTLFKYNLHIVGQQFKVSTLHVFCQCLHPCRTSTPPRAGLVHIWICFKFTLKEE